MGDTIALKPISENKNLLDVCYQNSSELTYYEDETINFVPNGLLSSDKNVDKNDQLPTILEVPKKPQNPLRTSYLSFGEPQGSINAAVTSFIHATSFEGKPVKFRKTNPVGKKMRSSSSSQNIAVLLDEPIHRLFQELSLPKVTDITTEQGRMEKEFVEDTLWVDRYRPQKFTDLIGNDSVAREAMGWVKQWDWCVFGKRKRYNRPGEGNGDFWNSDEFHRPREKLLLISGPPGIGKTTMAHVIAQQAGYHVLEINGSVARSGSIIEDRVVPALESGFTIGCSKPVLLIIDEIDGTFAGDGDANSFVHKLIRLTHDPLTFLRSREHKKLKSKDLNFKRPLLRPIICICNDPNVSSLAKLKPHTRHIRFQRPSGDHLVNRLREVAETERLKIDSRALTTLVDLTKGDIRSCLNILQFVKIKGENITEEIIRTATAGLRVTDASFNSVLTNLFTPLRKKLAKNLATSEEGEGQYVTRLERDMDECGKDALYIALGCFGHYTTLQHNDANFTRYLRANEWLLTFDTLSTAVYSENKLMDSYLPYTLIPFFPLFQQRGGPCAARYQTDWENHQVAQYNRHILKTLSRCLTKARLGGNFRHLVCSPVLELEFISLMNRIISPPIRPVNSQIIRAEERNSLARLADIMVSFELRFLRERENGGQPSYRLDPPLDIFITYEGKRASDVATLCYAARQLVSAEIDARVIAQEVDTLKRGKHARTPTALYSGRAGEDSDSFVVDNSSSKSLRFEQVNPKPTDFFGRVILSPLSDTNDKSGKTGTGRIFGITFQFKEGSSSAIRKSVKLETFV